MPYKKYRWSRDYESAEEELQQHLKRYPGATRWSGEAGQSYEQHAHEYDKKLWCAEGSIIYTIDGVRVSLQPGDALDLMANTQHQAVAGISGCVCYEAQL